MNTHDKTKTTRIGNKTYCSYCFEEAKEAYEWDEYDKSTWYYCTCESAEAEVVYNNTIKINEEKRKKLLFDYEVQLLKYKYSIK